MAAGWLKLLGTVPWGEVIGNAPKVADGAKKLWGAVAGKAAGGGAAAATHPPPPFADGTAPQDGAAAIAALQAKVASLEAAAADLHGQMLAGSELIKALAEQNAQLVKGVEAMRARFARLAVGTALVGLVAAAALLAALMAH